MIQSEFQASLCYGVRLSQNKNKNKNKLKLPPPKAKRPNKQKLKLLLENIETNPCDLMLGNIFLGMTLKAESTKGKLNRTVSKFISLSFNGHYFKNGVREVAQRF